MPLTVVVVVRALTDQLTIDALDENLSEILFFALMVSVSTVGDLFDVVKFVRKEYLLYGLIMFLILCALWSAVFYGFFHFDQLSGTNLPNFRPRLRRLSTGFAVILFVVTTSTQIFLSKIIPSEDKEK
jgi:hypothetical protein